MSKIELLKRGPSFQAGSANSLFLLLLINRKFNKESSFRFRDSLLDHSEHPEKAGSHVSVPDQKSKSVPTTISWSTSGLFSIV